jgi:hypothetical protein
MTILRVPILGCDGAGMRISGLELKKAPQGETPAALLPSSRCTLRFYFSRVILRISEKSPASRL